MRFPFEPYSDDFFRFMEGMDAVKRLFSCGDFDRDQMAAERLLDQARQIAPAHAQAKAHWLEMQARALMCLRHMEDAERLALEADALYDSMSFAECWAYPWLTLFEMALARGDFDAAGRWIARGRQVTSRLPDIYGHVLGVPPIFDECERRIADERRQMAVDAAVMADLRQRGEPVIQSAYCKACGIADPDAVGLALYRLAKAGRVTREKHGRSYLIRVVEY